MIISFKQHLSKQLSERYLMSTPAAYKKDSFYPVFENPSRSELKELFSEFGSLVRFIAHKNTIYVFPAELLHDTAFDKIEGLERNRRREMFEGVAKILVGEGKLKIHEMNTVYNDPISQLEKNPIVSKYFT
jgi:hypothetical protein